MGDRHQSDAAESAIQELGESILSQMDQVERGVHFREMLFNRIIALSMAHPVFKAQLFRLVDVLPALEHSAGIASHLREYLADPSIGIPAYLRVPARIGSYFSAVTGPLIRHEVSRMARRFMLPDDASGMLEILREQREKGLTYTVDLLGEAVVSEREAEDYARRVNRLLDRLSSGEGGKNRINISLKISALDARILPTDPDGAIHRLSERLRPLLRKAQTLGAFIHFDMEHHQLKELTLQLFFSLLEEEEFRHYPHFGVVIQAYLRESGSDLKRLLEWARGRSQPVTIRLVKGAYWDYETIVARQKNWPVPVFGQKAETDLQFEHLTGFLLENREWLTPAIASHNVRSIAHTLFRAEQLGLGPEAFEFQMLFGMADSLKTVLVERGFTVREYCPVGELIPGMAYLVRRLLENSSNEGFLASRFSRRASAAELLKNPAVLIAPSSETDAPSRTFPFQNAPPTDFTMQTEREKLKNAITSVRKRAGASYPMTLGGEAVYCPETIASANPTHPETVIGRVPRGGPAEANRAVEAALTARGTWNATPVENRARLLEKTADLLQARRFELAALEILECGKPWIEADADICEAIDFCRFYAEAMRGLARPELTQDLPGEENLQTWRPRGVTVVIAPWNFPLAILCGMTSAALVTGNTVILKPAEQSSVIAVWFMEILCEAGFPPGVVNLVTGYGEEVGEPLIQHPDVALIAFTGSRDVGLKIWEAAGKTPPGQTHLKKAICEMGGKNALIIDSDADLDEAVQGAVFSAFGYQGQKCSALSRLIVLENIYERFLERFIEATRAITIGDPAEPGIAMGPLIDEAARDKILRAIESGKEEASLAFQGTVPVGLDGYFVAPVIFSEVPRTAKIFREEIFGPVIAVSRVATFDEAITLANDSVYALTAGLYSRSPVNIHRAKAELEAGNIYINRAITGAVVGRQPFGGFKLSGGGTKAGGREYLTQFMVSIVLTENRMRHGFAPESDVATNSVPPFAP